MSTLTMGLVAEPVRASRRTPAPRRESATQSSSAMPMTLFDAPQDSHAVTGLTAPGKPPPAFELQFIYTLQWGLFAVVILRLLIT